LLCFNFVFFFFQAEDGIRDRNVTGVQTCALPICSFFSFSSFSSFSFSSCSFFSFSSLSSFSFFSFSSCSFFSCPSSSFCSIAFCFEEHTSELHSRFVFVCRLLLYNKNFIFLYLSL